MSVTGSWFVAAGLGLVLWATPAASPAQTPTTTTTISAPATHRDALRRSGLEHFYSLEYGAAIAAFHRLTQLEPNDPAAWEYLTQALTYREMYRIGALQSELYGHGDPFLTTKLRPVDPKAVTAILTADNTARTLANERVDKNPHSATAHYALAVAWALRGNVDFSLRKSYWSALGDAKNARREAELARHDDPHYIDPLLIIGVQNYVAGSLPWTVRLMSALVGYSGNKDKGRAQIAEVAAHGEHAAIDATVLLAVIDRRDGLNRQAAPLFAGLARQFPRNPLFAVETAEAYEAAGDHATARMWYERVLQRATAGAPNYDKAPLDKVWYDMGKIERVYSHWHRAAADFERVWNLPHARARYRQAAALAAAQSYAHAGDASAAHNAYVRCLSLGVNTPAGQAARKALEP